MIIAAMKKWRQYLLGRCFTIITDHKSLKELFVGLSGLKIIKKGGELIMNV